MRPMATLNQNRPPLDELVRERTAVAVWVAQHPVLAYFVLTFTISWLLWAPLVIFKQTDALATILQLAGGFGPPAAALVVTWVIGGRTAVRAWAARIVHRKVGLGWWLVALLGIPLLVFLGFGLFLAAGGHTVYNWHALPWYSYGLLFTFMFFFGGGEEPGWRGFALPRLQARYGALTAGLIIGVLWACWHLPLFFSPVWGQAPQFIWFAASVVAVSVILTWLFNNTGGSVLLAMVMHASLNAITNPPPVPVSAADQAGAFMAALAGVSWLAVLVLVAIFGPARLGRRPLEI